jgi:hypothetical protein
MSCLRDKEMLASLFVKQKPTTMVTNQTNYRSLVDCARSHTHHILLGMVAGIAMGIYTELLIRNS